MSNTMNAQPIDCESINRIRAQAVSLLKFSVSEVPSLGDTFTHLAHDNAALDAIYTLNASGMPMAAIVAQVSNPRLDELTGYRLLARALVIQVVTGVIALTE